MPIADSCSTRSGVSVAVLLRWLLIHAPSFSSRTCSARPLPSARPMKGRTAVICDGSSSAS
ncbi:MULTISPECIES: hypothetical protein [Streptomyces]|jgi:hypothetical protein|uniref:hypothetical protein n=1 Tax=Streptomyces TaxID=1883 RepID=UPI001302E2AE|nr:hypothetical protein [Streptomyces glaucescens]